MRKNNNIFNDIIKFIETEAYANVNLFNNDTTKMRCIFTQLLKKKFYRLILPKEEGGIGISAQEKVQLEKKMGMYGGALSFLQAQLWIPIRLLDSSGNKTLKLRVFNEINKNKMAIGNSLYQLKPGSKAYPTAIAVENGFLVNGTLSFASGWGLFDYIVVGIVDETANVEVLGLIPFTQKTLLDGIKIQEVLDTAIMQGVGTVSLEFTNYFLSDDVILHVYPRNELYKGVKFSPPYAYTLGIAHSALNLVDFSKTSSEKIKMTQKYFLDQIAHWELRITELPVAFNGPSLMIEILKFSWECLQFVAILLGGACSLKQHTFQRLLQEMLIWQLPRSTPEFIEAWCDLTLAHTTQ